MFCAIFSRGGNISLTMCTRILRTKMLIIVLKVFLGFSNYSRNLCFKIYWFIPVEKPLLKNVYESAVFHCSLVFEDFKDFSLALEDFKVCGLLFDEYKDYSVFPQIAIFFCDFNQSSLSLKTFPIIS